MTIMKMKQILRMNLRILMLIFITVFSSTPPPVSQALLLLSSGVSTVMSNGGRTNTRMIIHPNNLRSRRYGWWVPPPPPPQQKESTTTTFNRRSTQRSRNVDVYRSMTDNNNNSENDMETDALSKLIGKRNQIKRVSSSSSSSTSRTELMKDIEEKLANTSHMNGNESILDFDLDQLPEFQTPRIQRRSSSQDNNNNGDDDDSTTPNDTTSPIIDYLADYDDENDWHIPNRIMISSRAWGDVKQNFVVSTQQSTSGNGSRPNNNNNSNKKGKNSPTGMKLSPRLQKMGKFVAGDVQVAMQQCISNGIVAIETSSTYGNAVRSQKCSAHDIVRECIVDATNVGLPEPIIVESLSRKDLLTLRNLVFRPATSMVSYLEQSLGRLGLSQSGAVDMFIVPHYWGIPSSWITQALVAQMESGQTNYIGVSGVTRVSTLRKLQDQIQNLDYTLSANVIPFSLTNQKYLYMIQVCKDLGIVPLIRDPLDGGLSSGVYTAMNPSGGMVSSSSSSSKNNKFSFAQLEKLQPLHSVQETLCDRVRTRVIRNMRTIQDKYSSLSSRYSNSPVREINTDITTTQIALQYVIAKGGVPMVPVNNPIQAEQVLGCLGWTLTDDEVAMLDAAIALCQL